jgi:hypothetical protein
MAQFTITGITQIVSPIFKKISARPDASGGALRLPITQSCIALP